MADAPHLSADSPQGWLIAEWRLLGALRKWDSACDAYFAATGADADNEGNENKRDHLPRN